VDGEPLPGAEVYLGTISKGIDGFKPDPRRTPRQITEADGKFSFPMPADGVAVVAVYHPDGFVQAEAQKLAKSPRLFIQPWARIEGVLLDGDKTLANQFIFVGAILHAGDPLGDCITHQTTTRTDKEGKFVLARVAPIGVHVYRQLRTPWYLQNKDDYLDLKPGEVAKVQLGGTGRHVIGRLLPPPIPVPGIKGQWVWRDDKAKIHASVSARYVDVKPFFFPANVDPAKLDAKAQRELQEAWRKTPQGLAFMKHQNADEYPIEPDGTFRFEDLTPGKYDFYAAVRHYDREHNFLEDVVTAHLTFEVPPMPPGQTRDPKPLNLGDIKVELTPRLIVGEPAPDFKAESLDGQPLTLASFKGKYLLLHLRQQWAREQSWESLQKAHAILSDQVQGAMLTIHLAGPIDIPKLQAQLEEKGVTWQQAVVSRSQDRRQHLDSAKVPLPYQQGLGVTLIGPDGKIVARNIRPEKAETDIAKTLLELR
jgi:hypothetical protein